MMRLLKTVKSGAKNRPTEEAAETADAGDDALVQAVGEALAQAVGGEEGAADEADAKPRRSEAKARPRGKGGVEIESEIASILATIRSRKAGDVLPESELPEETGATYQLLSELDRIWRSA